MLRRRVHPALVARVHQWLPWRAHLLHEFKHASRRLSVAEGVRGELFVADHDRDCVCVYSAGGVLQREWGLSGNAKGEFHGPRSIAVSPPGGMDSPEGEVFVVDGRNYRVQVFHPDGTFLRFCGKDVLQFPDDIAVSPAGEVVVTDCGLYVLVLRQSDGVFLRQWVPPPSVVEFLPVGVCVTAYGEVSGNARAQRHFTTWVAGLGLRPRKRVCVRLSVGRWWDRAAPVWFAGQPEARTGLRCRGT